MNILQNPLCTCTATIHATYSPSSQAVSPFPQEKPTSLNATYILTSSRGGTLFTIHNSFYLTFLKPLVLHQAGGFSFSIDKEGYQNTYLKDKTQKEKGQSQVLAIFEHLTKLRDRDKNDQQHLKAPGHMQTEHMDECTFFEKYFSEIQRSKGQDLKQAKFCFSSSLSGFLNYLTPS